MKCDSCEYGTKDLSVEVCDGCGASLRQVDGIEIGHCFDLGTRYSESMGLEFAREDGGLDHVLMASYGIGVSRVIAAVIEQNHDNCGIDWNSEVSAFDVSIVLAHHADEARNEARRVHDELEESGLDVLLYDGRRSVGERFAESDLLGIGLKVVVGNNYLGDGELELETRGGTQTTCDAKELTEEVICRM
jgi:Prolyl-tRNA synthetase